MAKMLSLLSVANHLRCSIDLPPQPIRAQFSLVLGAAAIRLAAGKKRVADQAPAATAVRLRKERRFNVGFMLCNVPLAFPSPMRKEEAGLGRPEKKHQAPNSKLQGSHKHQTTSGAAA